MDKINEVFSDFITESIIADDTLFILNLFSFFIYITVVIALSLGCRKSNKELYRKGIAFAHLLICMVICFAIPLLIKWWIALVVCFISVIAIKRQEEAELKRLDDGTTKFKGISKLTYITLSLASFILGQGTVYLHFKLGLF